MVTVQEFPSADRITRIWLTQLQTRYPDCDDIYLKPQLYAAMTCFYKSLYGEQITWDARGLMTILTPQPTFGDMVHVFISLRIAVREAATSYNAETILALMEKLDRWIEVVLTRYDRLRTRKTEQLWQNTVQRIAQLNTLSHCTAKLNMSLDLASAFSAAVELAQILSGADLCVLYQHDENSLKRRAYTGDTTIPAATISIDSAKMLEQIVIDHQDQDGLLDAVRKKLNVPTAQAICCLPLQINDITTGEIVLIYLEETHFTLQELRVYEIFAGHVAQAIYNAQLYEQVATFTAANERWQIACEMHDTLLQTLISLTINLRVLQEQAQQSNWDDARSLIQSARDLCQTAVQEGRDTLTDLRENNCACHMQNLVDALQLEAAAFADRSQIEPAFLFNDDVYLSPNVNHHLCRLAGEALANVHRHADANQVTISLHNHDDYVLIKVQDDGIGFNPARIDKKHSFGLIGMQERARFIDARVEVYSTPGNGTSVFIHYPLEHRDSSESSELSPDLQTFSDRNASEL